MLVIKLAYWRENMSESIASFKKRKHPIDKISLFNILILL